MRIFRSVNTVIHTGSIHLLYRDSLMSKRESVRIRSGSNQRRSQWAFINAVSLITRRCQHIGTETKLVKFPLCVPRCRPWHIRADTNNPQQRDRRLIVNYWEYYSESKCRVTQMLQIFWWVQRECWITVEDWARQRRFWWFYLPSGCVAAAFHPLGVIYNNE